MFFSSAGEKCTQSRSAKYHNTVRKTYSSAGNCWSRFTDINQDFFFLFFLYLPHPGHAEGMPAGRLRERLRLPRWAAVHFASVLCVLRAHGSVRPDQRGGGGAHEASGRLQQGGAGGRRDGRRDRDGAGAGRPLLHDGGHRRHRRGYGQCCGRGQRWCNRGHRRSRRNAGGRRRSRGTGAASMSALLSSPGRRKIPEKDFRSTSSHTSSSNTLVFLCSNVALNSQHLSLCHHTSERRSGGRR